jgi:hypothetical protein
MPTELNLSDLANNGHKYELSVSGDSPEDAAARRLEAAAEAKLKRTMALCTFVFALAVVATIFAGCVYLFIVGTADDKKWAAGIVSAIASGLIGFLLGKR